MRAGRQASAGRGLGLACAGVLIAATLGEGGARPVSMIVWHGALAGLVLWAVWTTRGAGSLGRRIDPPLLAPLTLFLLLFAVGLLRAPYRFGALLVGLELACCLAAGWVAVRAEPTMLRRCVTPLQIAAAAQAAWAFADRFVLDGGRPAGTFLNPNHMALWLVAVTLLAVGSARRGDGGRELRRRLLWALPALAATVLTGSRGALLGCLAGAAWLGWVSRGRISTRWRWALAGTAVVLLAAAVQIQLERVGRHDPFRYHRAKIWKASASIAAESPWWGAGPGQLAAAAARHAFPDGDGPLRYDRTFAVTHSDLVRLPAELGLPAAVAALAVLLVGVRGLARRRREGAPPAVHDGALAALVAIAAHGLVDNPSGWPAVYLLASTLAGSVLGGEGRALPARGRKIRIPSSVALVLVFLVADLAPFLAWNQARRLPSGPLDEAQRARLERAIAWNPLHPDYRIRKSEDLVASEGWSLTAYAGAREEAEHAARLHPRSAAVQRALALLESRACKRYFADPSCRRRVVERSLQAERRAPYDALLPVSRARFLLDTGDPAGARRAAERALSLEPDSVLPRLLLADAFIESGSETDLRRAATLLAEARERAERWAGWSQGDYGRQLLRPDPRHFERLERKLETTLARRTAKPQ